MQKINLREIDPDVYKTDNLMEGERVKKKSRRNGMLLLLAAILVCWLVRVIQVNRTYPEAETKRYSFGETLEQDGLAIRVLESRWAEEEEVAASMASDGDEMAKFGERKQLLVTVQLKNTGSESKRVEVYQYMIELPCYSNGIIMEAFIYYNPEKSLNPALEAGEELRNQGLCKKTGRKHGTGSRFSGTDRRKGVWPEGEKRLRENDAAPGNLRSDPADERVG